MNLKLLVGVGGWVYSPTPGSDREIRVRFVERADGRFEAVELSIRDEGSVTGIGLRSVPLGRIEAFVNRPDVAATMRQRMHDEHEAQVAARQQKKMIGALNALAPSVPYDFEDDPDAWAGPKTELTIPTTRKKPDAFYMQVAAAFQALASTDPRPALVLAEANHVPVSTVHRWVKEARRRGILAPGRRSPQTTTIDVEQGPSSEPKDTP